MPRLAAKPNGTGAALSDTDGVAITVNPVNDAPANTVPAAQTTNEDTNVVFSNLNGNLIAVSDVDDADNAVQFRRGWFLGDGTGAGKGRQVAGILLDNWLKGRRRAVWISKSDKLIEDAQRDWSALAMERLLVTPLSRFRQGTPIRLDRAWSMSRRGALFARTRARSCAA